MSENARAEIRIAAAPAAVYPWLIEPERIGRWIGGTQEMRVLTPPPAGEGTRMHHVIVQSGRRIEIDARVVTAEPSRRAVLEQRAPGLFDMIMAHDLSERGGGTLLVTTLEAELRSWAARLAAPLIARQVQSTLEEDLERL